MRISDWSSGVCSSDLKPDIPILVVENADASINSLNFIREEDFDRVNNLAREAFDAMKDNGLKNIYLLPAREIVLGIESTVDGVQPNDIGMLEYALDGESVEKGKSVAVRVIKGGSR